MGPEPKAPPQSQAEARSIVDALREPILILDHHLRVRTASRAFCQTFQVLREDIEGQLIYDVGNGQWDIPALRIFLEQIVPEHTEFNGFELTHEFLETGRRTMLLNARKICRETNDTNLLLLAIDDVTERYQAEAESRRIAELYQRLLANTPDCVKVLDPGARLLEMSENGARALCLSSVAEFLGTDWLSFWKGAEREAAERAVNEARNGHIGRFEGYLPTFTGEPRWWDVAVNAVFGKDGKPEYLLAVSRDITDRKKAGEALAASNEKLGQTATELKRSNEDLKNFAQIAGHDLKAPLRTMVLFSELLAKNWKEIHDDESRKAFDLILQAGKRATGLIDALLGYSMLAQAPVIASEPVTANDCCALACDNLRSEIERTGADVESCLPSTVKVNLEGSLLMQVFQNLIDNAIHYRKERVAPRIRVTAEEQRQKWLFCVEDNGVGIESSHSVTIFQPFRRLHGPERPGYGIGLSSCKRIIERGHGRIWVESRPDEGSRFYFLLPKAHPSSVPKKIKKI